MARQKRNLEVRAHRYEGEVIPGLPANGRAVVVSNSELSTLECAHKWWLSRANGLRPERTAMVLSWGTGLHAVVEDINRFAMFHDGHDYPTQALDTCWRCAGTGSVSEIVDPLGNIAPRQETCPLCSGVGWGALRRVLEGWLAGLESENPSHTRDDVDDMTLRLQRAVHGYLVRWNGRPVDTMRVVAVERPFARAIIDPTTGRPYRPSIDVAPTDDGWALASTLPGVVHQDVQRVRWPWFALIKPDAVLVERRGGALWTIDTKSAADTGKFAKRFALDPQLPLYSWVLSAHLSALGASRIGGVAYDVVSSALQRDPDELKPEIPAVADMKAMAAERGIDVKGLLKDDLVRVLGINPKPKLSLKRAITPTWRFRAAMERLGISGMEYEDHLMDLEATVDRRLYRRDWHVYSDESMDRVKAETFARCRRSYEMHKRAVLVQQGNADVHVEFPRTPVCLSPGKSCALEAACTMGQDAPGFRRVPVLVWRETAPAVSAATADHADDVADDGDGLGW
jgi:hypothetical protein